MKTNAIVRIILFSLAILILLGILITGLGVSIFAFHNNETPLEVTGSWSSIDAASIRDMNIEWAAGNITIQPVEGTDQITISETGGTDKHRLHYSVSGDTLNIQFSKDSIKFPSFGISVNFDKDLLIEIPSDWYCEELDIDAAAVDIYISNMTIGELNFDGASGALNLTECDIHHLDADSASGNIQFSGTLGSMDCDAASADCNIHVSNVPSEINLSSMSGDLNLTLPENCGFTCSSDTLSGKFQSDFFTTVKESGTYVYGDGTCRINVDGMSGDVNIKKHAATSETSPIQDCTDPNCAETAHGHSTICLDENCTDTSHNHGDTCQNTNCTDASHNHGIACNDSDCTDATHNHQTNHSNTVTHHSETEQQ